MSSFLITIPFPETHNPSPSQNPIHFIQAPKAKTRGGLNQCWPHPPRTLPHEAAPCLKAPAAFSAPSSRSCSSQKCRATFLVRGSATAGLAFGFRESFRGADDSGSVLGRAVIAIVDVHCGAAARAAGAGEGWEGDGAADAGDDGGERDAAEQVLRRREAGRDQRQPSFDHRPVHHRRDGLVLVERRVERALHLRHEDGEPCCRCADRDRTEKKDSRDGGLAHEREVKRPDLDGVRTHLLARWTLVMNGAYFLCRSHLRRHLHSMSELSLNLELCLGKHTLVGWLVG